MPPNQVAADEPMVVNKPGATEKQGIGLTLTVGRGAVQRKGSSNPLHSLEAEDCDGCTTNCVK